MRRFLYACLAAVTVIATARASATGWRSDSGQLPPGSQPAAADSIGSGQMDVMSSALDELVDDMTRKTLDRLTGNRSWLQELSPLPEVDVDTASQEQELESILDEIDPVTVIASNRAGVRGTSPGRALWSLLQSPFAVVHAAAQDEALPLRMLVTSLGVSTGDAFTVQFLNLGATPITLPRGSLTLRPLKPEAGERAKSEFTQLTGRATTVTMYGYCLNYEKLAPRAGMVYAIAPRAVQEKNLPVRRILRAATVLNAGRLLNPEGDRRQYVHSIRQWALWTAEQRFTERPFTNAMIGHARKNLSQTKQPWTSAAEATARASAARRWRDVSNVLLLANEASARQRTP